MIDAVMSGDALDRAGDVAQRVELLVGGSDLGRLADQRAADPLHAAAQLVERETGPEAGNRLELVERTARMAEAAPRHHRDGRAARRRERREHDRGLVAHAAGAVLVHGSAAEPGIVHPHARSHHRVSEGGGLLRGHAAQDDRHEQG
jgi:hypothetical protein